MHSSHLISVSHKRGLSGEKYPSPKCHVKNNQINPWQSGSGDVRAGLLSWEPGLQAPTVTASRGTYKSPNCKPCFPHLPRAGLRRTTPTPACRDNDGQCSPRKD